MKEMEKASDIDERKKKSLKQICQVWNNHFWLDDLLSSIQCVRSEHILALQHQSNSRKWWNLSFVYEPRSFFSLFRTVSISTEENRAREVHIFAINLSVSKMGWHLWNWLIRKSHIFNIWRISEKRDHKMISLWHEELSSLQHHRPLRWMNFGIEWRERVYLIAQK